MPPYIQVGVARSSRCQLNPADLVSAITGAQYVADGARTAADGAAHLGDPELSRAAEKRQPLYRSQSCTHIGISEIKSIATMICRRHDPPENGDSHQDDTRKRRVANSTAGPLPNRIFDAGIPLPAGCLKPAQVTDIKKILGDGRVFFGA